jgi:hypothetical protein
MLPGFTASSSLYRSRQAYAGYGSLSGDATQLAGSWGMVIPANLRVPSFWCSADTPCPTGFTCCNFATPLGYSDWGCFDLQSNPDNCGACGNMCRASEPVCCDGRCIAQRDGSCGCPGRACPPGHKCCEVFVGGFSQGFKCVNVTNSTEHCGSCNQRCSSGQTCCDGTCCSAPCCGGECCPQLAKCVNGKCCYPKGDIAGAAALLCLLTLGSDCDAIYQQLLQEACP